MRDTEQLRKEAGQLLVDADKANGQGKSELAKRLQARAAQGMQDAAVLEAAEIRLQAERAKTSGSTETVGRGKVETNSARVRQRA
jgi:hypothetical protein